MNEATENNTTVEACIHKEAELKKIPWPTYAIPLSIAYLTMIINSNSTCHEDDGGISGAANNKAQRKASTSEICHTLLNCKVSLIDIIYR